MSAQRDRDATRPDREGFVLSAPVAGGEVRLGWGPAVGDAAQAAIALREDGAWIDLLEDWLAPVDGLDWRPADEAVDDNDWITATVVGEGRAPRLALPWRLLRALPAPSDELGLHWPALPAELLMARQSLPPEDPGLLEPGSVLLLEDSFAPTWRVQLRRIGEARGRDLLCDGRLAWPADGSSVARPFAIHGGVDGPIHGATDAAIHAASDAAIDATAEAGLEVRMPLAHAVPVPLLLGWHARDTAFAIDAPLTLHLRHHGDEPIAEGHLLPWGRGHALRVVDMPEGDAWLRRLREDHVWPGPPPSEGPSASAHGVHR